MRQGLFYSSTFSVFEQSEEANFSNEDTAIDGIYRRSRGIYGSFLGTSMYDKHPNYEFGGKIESSGDKSYQLYAEECTRSDCEEVLDIS